MPLRILLLALLAFPASISYAANDGILDPTSNGDFDITLTIPGRVNITDLDTLDFGTYVLNSGQVSQNDDICIYSNTSSARYDVTITGDGAASAYTVTNGSDAQPYFVRWNDEIGTTSNALMATGVALTNRTGANAESSTCVTGGKSANIEVIFNNPTSLSNGDYLGTMTILIEPR